MYIHTSTDFDIWGKTEGGWGGKEDFLSLFNRKYFKRVDINIKRKKISKIKH